MAEPTPSTAGPVLPKAFITQLLGAKEGVEAKLTEQVLDALQKISPSLVPRLFSHPLSDHIVRGVKSFPRLIELLEKETKELNRTAIVDAMAEIISREHATKEALIALTAVVSKSKSDAVVSVACRAIALARDEAFLDQQYNFLASDRPSDVRLSARLLGYAKYEKAVPVLLSLIHTDQMAVADALIWALGEIGSPEALPKLHAMMSDHILTDHCLEAVGKIGDATSVVRLMPILLEGTDGQREAAARALSRIARKNDGWLGDAALESSTRVALERTIAKDRSALTRFYAIQAYSLLGGRLDPAMLMSALGAKLSKKDMDAISAFFSEPKGEEKKKRETSSGGEGPKKGRKRKVV